MPRKNQLKVKPNTFKQKLDEYLKLCETERRTPFKHEFAYLLGISEDTLRSYNQHSKYAPEIKRLETAGKTAIVKALDKDAKANINKMFLAKAVFGLVEQQKVDVTTDGKAMSGLISLPRR